jgi:hypothetical protein
MSNINSAVVDIINSSGNSPEYLTPATLAHHCGQSGSNQSTNMVPAPRSSLESEIHTQDEVDYKPWKYIGYQGYTKCLASETDFLVFRRFGVVSTRILLRLQDRVVVLQEKLEKLDRQFKARDVQDIHNGSFRQDHPDREKVLDELHVALSKYSESS